LPDLTPVSRHVVFRAASVAPCLGGTPPGVGAAVAGGSVDALQFVGAEGEVGEGVDVSRIWALVDTPISVEMTISSRYGLKSSLRCPSKFSSALPKGGP